MEAASKKTTSKTKEEITLPNLCVFLLCALCRSNDSLIKRISIAGDTVASGTLMPEIVLASRNAKKAIEIARLLEPVGLNVLSLDQFSDAPNVEETGSTFAENAALKAGETAQAIGKWTIADDSGLQVDALNGEPGIYSARYAGENATDADNNAKLLDALSSVPAGKRAAGFVCHLAVADPAGVIRASVESQCRGVILENDRGSHGFGYDPLFLVPEFHRTFGQLSLLVKSQISHRARAFHQLMPKLQRLLQEM